MEVFAVAQEVREVGRDAQVLAPGRLRVVGPGHEGAERAVFAVARVPDARLTFLPKQVDELL